MAEFYRELSRALWVQVCFSRIISNDSKHNAQGAANLTAAAIECTAAMSIDSTLQDNMLKVCHLITLF